MDIKENIKEILNSGFDALFPSNITCILCGDEVNESKFCLCDNCEEILNREYKICKCCGTKIKSEADYCKMCMSHERYFKYARAPFVYEGGVKNAVIGFKYNNKRYLAKYFANIMLDCFHELENLTDKFDFIIPVPLHKDKLKKRGFNQSELLAKEISKLTSTPLKTDLIVKILNTDAQVGLSREERLKNLTDAFLITDKKLVKGKNILIVDDIVTTGATAESISKLLVKSKAKTICVLSIARTECE